MKIKNICILSTLMFLCIILVGCNKKTEMDSSKKVENKKNIVAVSIVPEKTFVKAVCKDLAEVVTIIPPGSSPENYEPTPKEKELFSKASVYFSIGVPTEEANILPNIGKTKVVSLADKVRNVYPDRKFESGQRDPHIWLSPKRAKVMINTIAEEMIKIDPANKNVYNKNAKTYIKKLDELDKQIKLDLNKVNSKKFIAYHPAFGYIADDYGLKMYTLECEGKEATASHLQKMIDLAKSENIKAVFYQKEIDSSQSKAFSEEINGKTVQLEPLAEDYINNLKKMAKTMKEDM